MIERLCRFMFWSALIFALVMANLPQPLLVGAGDDKFMHMLAFAVLAALAAIAYQRVHLLLLFSGLALFGALIELTQLFSGHGRQADYADWVADIVAAGAVLTAIGLIRLCGSLLWVNRDPPSGSVFDEKP